MPQTAFGWQSLAGRKTKVFHDGFRRFSLVSQDSNSAVLSLLLFQFTVTKVDEDEETQIEDRDKTSKNGPVSQFHLLQVYLRSVTG